MSIYPNVWGVEATHQVQFWIDDPSPWTYYQITSLDGEEAATKGGVPPDETLDGGLFDAGYQVVGAMDFSNPDRPKARVRPMPELLVPVVRARRKLLVSQGSETAKAEMRDAIAPLLDSGVSEYAAAEMLGVTRMTVRNWRNPS